MHFFSRAVVLCITLLCVQQSFPQQNDPTHFIFLPGKLDLPPLTASYQESRVGLRKEIATSNLKVDIGAALDILEFRPSSDSTDRIRFGIDFFTYALSTNSQGLHLQIDAVDGYFGGHVTYVHDRATSSRFALRLRLIHLSAHFLDGHFNNATQTWKDNRAPIPFTRDFGELVASNDFQLGGILVKLYGGFSYATLVRPTNIKRIEVLAGLEVHRTTNTLFDKPFNLYLADHFGLRGIPAYIGTNNLEFGVKLGEWYSSGLKIYISYYNGLEVFSQYYDVRTQHWGLGFAFDFW